MRAIIDTPHTFTDRSFQNASDYAVHEAVPGSYPAVWVDHHHNPVRPGERPAYLLITVRTILRETGGTNRLFSATSQVRDTHDTPSTYTITKYAYEVNPDGPPVPLFGGAGRLTAGVSVDKVRVPDRARRGAQCARDAVVYERGRAWVNRREQARRDGTPAVSLDHVDRAAQQHKFIPGEHSTPGNLSALPSMWMRTSCDCTWHAARRHAAQVAQWRAARAPAVPQVSVWGVDPVGV